MTNRREQEDERERAEQPCSRRRAAERFGKVVDEHDREHDAADQAGPRRDAPYEPHPVADPTRGRGGRDDEEVEEVHALDASNRACVRKPVCATIRWSGRTDWPSTCQVRCSTSSVSIMPNVDPASSSRSRATWPIVGR